MGDVNVSTEGDGGAQAVTPASDAIDLAEKIGTHTAEIAQHGEKLAEHDGLIAAATDSAKFAHERIDNIGSGEAGRVDDIASRLSALEGDVAELKAKPAAEELGGIVGDGADAIVVPAGEAVDDAAGAAVDAPASVENVAEHEEHEAKGVMGFLRKLNIH